MPEYLQTAIEAAKRAGKIHKKYYSSPMEVKRKGDSFNLVTDADVEAEEVIVSAIKEKFPGHNFIAEEKKYGGTDSEYKWIIDPLDGTNNFFHKLPLFCASIALAKGDELQLGVIYDAINDELFYAQKGEGAFLDGKKIHVSKMDKLEESLLITGFYYDRGKEMLDNLERLKKFFHAPILGIRRLGSAALDLCFIACGRASGFWEFELNVWDFAAGKIIIEEAGGTVTDRSGGPVALNKSYVVASNGKIHDKMLEILR